MVLRGTSDLGAAELLERLDRALVAKGKWTMVADAQAGAPSRVGSDWTFTGRHGEAWTGRLTIQAVAGEPSHRYEAHLVIEQAGASGSPDR